MIQADLWQRIHFSLFMISFARTSRIILHPDTVFLRSYTGCILYIKTDAINDNAIIIRN